MTVAIRKIVCGVTIRVSIGMPSRRNCWFSSIRTGSVRSSSTSRYLRMEQGRMAFAVT